MANADEWANELHELHRALMDELVKAQDSQAVYYDREKKRLSLEKGLRVWLHNTNIKSQRPCKKLDWKRQGPFEVLGSTTPNTYRLKLPHQMEIWPVFHISMLDPYHKNNLPGRVVPPPPPVDIITDEGGDCERP